MCGLKSGEHGVKNLLKTRCPRAFRRYDSLQAARDGVLPDGAPQNMSRRARTAVLVDGNVCLHGVPESVGTMEAFTAIVYGYVRDALRAGSLVVVVLDEPEHMTFAKREEQNRRDAQRRAREITCSDDMAAVGLQEDFTREQLDALDDVFVLCANRRCRQRLFDEVMLRVFDRARKVIDQWDVAEHGTTSLLIDGLDARGCERGVGEARLPAMVGNDDAVRAAFARTAPIGEGDMKLQDVETRLRRLVSTPHSGYERYCLCITSTVDTDTFMAGTIDVAKRRVAPFEGALHALFCMREPATKRDREFDADARATFLACDVALLEGMLQEHVWSRSTPTPTAQQMLHAILAFASASALCGCDFTSHTGQKGSRADHFWDALPDFVAQEPHALARFGCALAADVEVAQGATDGLQRFCVCASEKMRAKPRYARQADAVADTSDTMLLRSCWAAAYWAANEFEALPSWGFLPHFA